jgi:Trk-type K+ transport system membrane component
MANNLGFTLTPDSMISFRDATWPMLIMTFLAFAGNTCYPIFLRLIIWIAAKTVPRESSTRETLQFLLDHPRRCYTLLFPSGPTKILFGIIFALNFIDVLLIILLDLDNPEVNGLAVGPRILAALFQAASARHTGTATFNLALVNPGVQFSLLVMMYIAVLPIAISIRASNTYEEKTLGIYRDQKEELDEADGKSYLMTHIRNQFSFDLWYIFLGTFCICIAEASRIMDATDPVSNRLASTHARVLTLKGFCRLPCLLRGRLRVRQRRAIARPPDGPHLLLRPVRSIQQGGHLRHDDSWASSRIAVCARQGHHAAQRAAC